MATENDARNWLDVWGAKLGGLAGDDIARGLQALEPRAAQRLRDGVEDWPPSADEFKAMCLARARPEHALALPAPRDTKDRSAELARIAEAIKGGSPRDEEWRRTFFSRPSSQIACDMVTKAARTPGRQQQRFVDHLAAAIAGSYMTEDGKWTGNRA